MRTVHVAAVLVAVTLALAASTAQGQWLGRSAQPHGNRFFNQFAHPMMRQAFGDLDAWHAGRFGRWPDTLGKRHVWHPQQAAREQAAREQAAREQAAREQAAREQAAREQAAREQAAREQAARRERHEKLQQAVREREARLQEQLAASHRQQQQQRQQQRHLAAPPAARDETAEYDDRYELVVQPRRDMWRRPIPFRVQYGGGGTTVVVREMARGGFYEEYAIPTDVNPRAITTRTGRRGELIVTFPRTQRAQPRVEQRDDETAASKGPCSPPQVGAPDTANHDATARSAQTDPAAHPHHHTPGNGRVQASRSAAEDAEARAERKQRREERYREWQHQQHLKRAQEEMRKEREAQGARQQREHERQARGTNGLSRVSDQRADEASSRSSSSGRLRRREHTTTTVVEEFGHGAQERKDVEAAADDWLEVEDVPVEDMDGEDVAEADPDAASGYWMRGDFVEY